MAARSRWRVTLVASALVGALLLAGCTAETPPTPALSPRALTTEESERLAVVRFNNYNALPITVSGMVGDGSQPLNFVGYVDYASHVGPVSDNS